MPMFTLLSVMIAQFIVNRQEQKASEHLPGSLRTRGGGCLTSMISFYQKRATQECGIPIRYSVSESDRGRRRNGW